jgi:hypothetical protein
LRLSKGNFSCVTVEPSTAVIHIDNKFNTTTDGESDVKDNKG